MYNKNLMKLMVHCVVGIATRLAEQPFAPGTLHVQHTDLGQGYTPCAVSQVAQQLYLNNDGCGFGSCRLLALLYVSILTLLR